MKQQVTPNILLKLLGSAIFSTCLITACSDGGNSTESNAFVVTEPPNLSIAQASDSPLASSSAQTVGHFVRNGVYLMQTSYVLTDVELDNNAANSAPRGADSQYSQTNTQEVGVDEADRIEYNGSHLFVSDVPVWTESEGTTKHVRILERQEDFSLNEVSSIALEEGYNAGGLYLNSDKLGVLSQSYHYYPVDIALTTTAHWHQPSNVVLQLFDVSSPQAPALDTHITIDGGLVGSRRIDNHLYLVTNFMPYIDELIDGEITDDTLVEAYNRLHRMSDDAFLPQLVVNGRTSNLFEFEQCLLPQDVDLTQGFAQMISVSRIDMNNPSNIESQCMIIAASNLYMSSDSLYLTAFVDRNTVLHKVALDQNISYQASGVVQGELGWRGPAQFRLSEHEGIIRILTTTYEDPADPDHTLYVLQQQGEELTIVGQLPNEQAPDEIGKPGEDVYAVRYFENKAYVVTFERMDPLYVIDLSSPTQPTITGSLEIPGFSNYIQPVGEGLLFAIGQQVDPFGIPDTGDIPLSSPLEDGLKVSLFDVRDPANPLLLKELGWGDAYTPAEYDYRALSVLNRDGIYYFGLPIEKWRYVENSGWYNEYALQAIEVNALDSTMTLQNSIAVPTQDGHYIYGGEDRSVLHGDNVYYLRGNQVWLSPWVGDQAVTGPF